MAERGWSLEQVKADIEKRKPDFAAYVAPQMQYSDIVISVLPSEISQEPVGKHLKVKLLQKLGKTGLTPAYILDKDASVTVKPTAHQVKTDVGIHLASYQQKYYNNDVSVVEMDGKLNDLNDFKNIENFLSNTAAKTGGEVAGELLKVGDKAPGSLDGTGLFQTVTALKLREYYEFITGKSIA
jgi:phosphoribulokinase